MTWGAPRTSQPMRSPPEAAAIPRASSLPPRAVLVTRPTELDELIARHGTLAQVRFHLKSRGQSLDDLTHRHDRQAAALQAVQSAIPLAWRRARVSRESLDRFLFEPEDLVIAVGQDGLVANTAKYLHGQPVLGINPLPEFYEGVLVRYPAGAAPDALATFAANTLSTTPHTMVQATLADGQRLVALNEVFIGHRTHQSARYTLNWQSRSERQSSSGVIVATGTGATGWAKSIVRNREGAPALPTPDAPALSFFVREAWPSRSTGATLTDGIIENDCPLTLTSEMNEGGTLFGDGLEDDRLDFSWGQVATLGPADHPLQLARL